MSLNCHAQDEGTPQFYEKQKEGWFWYHDPLPKPEEEPGQEINQVQEVQQQENRYRGTDLEKVSLEELWTMYPDDFQELLDHVQNLAVQAPTEENTLRYLIMQDVARRKALAYTNSAMYVTQKYGNLFNVNQVYPTSRPGVTARVQMQNQEIGQTIRSARNDHALIYFTSPTCGFCEKQSGILAYFVDKYGWTVKPVDIGQQPGIAERFGIETTPALLLIKKGMKDYMPVSVGVVVLTELERKLYRAVRYLQGETRDDNFLMYDFQKGSAFDATSILDNEGKQPWQEK
ncbi:conjugal transfer protein TraF [Desulfogranum marinum]|uniref:conjugal transfer protein TraF n=1 Tax=Desulfogranum marinum TaxID=453220 RepID=UPI001962DB6C|nr:conjugal transfer protein TraF [Desulfogranum marinum]MBM9514851.1 conjugal transfer protein TraF [Desulfogranum marinum]